jgi:DNA-binding transcriptional regulator YdaS (Cro superfamily)
MHRRTEQLIAKLKAWCDVKYGRRSAIARELGVSPALVTDWLKGRRMPSYDQGVRIEEIIRRK